MVEALARGMGELRHEPTQKRVRALVGDTVAVDSTRALLVYEPRRVVPSYAVPASDVRGRTGGGGGRGRGFRGRGLAARQPGRPAHPRPVDPLPVHTTDGQPQTLRIDGQDRERVAFRPADPDLAEYVILDFDGFDAWYDEDEQVVAHPRDPFHAMEILRTSRVVRVEVDGRLLAESRGPGCCSRARSSPSAPTCRARTCAWSCSRARRESQCAYKGRARYWSVDGHADIAWTYEEPLRGGRASPASSPSSTSASTFSWTASAWSARSPGPDRLRDRLRADGAASAMCCAPASGVARSIASSTSRTCSADWPGGPPAAPRPGSRRDRTRRVRAPGASESSRVGGMTGGSSRHGICRPWQPIHRRVVATLDEHGPVVVVRVPAVPACPPSRRPRCGAGSCPIRRSCRAR